jgi:hypothetical protein
VRVSFFFASLCDVTHEHSSANGSPPAANDMSVSSENNDVREAPAVNNMGKPFEISDCWDAAAAA